MKVSMLAFMEITAADKSAIPKVANLLGTVFADDPAMIEYVHRAKKPNLALQKMFSSLLEVYFVPDGFVDVAQENGQLLGAALWAQPNVSLGLRHYLRLVPSLVTTLGSSFRRAAQLSFADSRVEPKFEHWYLFVIAAASAARGRGVGGALLDHGISRAGDRAIYLESTGPRSQALYERKGFVPLGKIPSPGTATEVGMWRPPRGL